MSNIELDDFDDFRKFIKNTILSQQDLWKLIFYSTSSALNCNYSEDPYVIFNDDEGTHGVVLFEEKDITILNYTNTILLITFRTNKDNNNYTVQNIEIEIKIVLKGDIQELADGSNRAYRIAKLFTDNLVGVQIDNHAKIRRKNFEPLTLNEENYGFKLTFISKSTSYSDEIQVYTYSKVDDSYGVSRVSYNLLSTSNPILVGIQVPSTDDRVKENYGYNLNETVTMICDSNLGITESSIIKFNNNYYRIVKILEYEDYLDCSLVVTYNAVINPQ